MNEVLEIALFQLKKDISKEQFISYSENFQKEFVHQQEGFIERKLVHSENGVWADIVTWRDMECATSVETKMGGNPHVLKYMNCLESDSIKLYRMNILNTYMKRDEE